MEWAAQSDNYCERLDLTYWSEPLNALTNAAFIIAALIMLYRLRGTGLIGAHVLVVILMAIGVGSFLFHTHATHWAALADMAPIGLFILAYLFLVNKDILSLPLWAALLATLGFLPYAYFVYPIFDALPFFKISDFYWIVPLLLALYSPLVWRKSPETAKGMLLGAAILVVSITLRSLDMPLCGAFPIGTHIFWHILNGVMLGWMIEVYRCHMLAAAGRAV